MKCSTKGAALRKELQSLSETYLDSNTPLNNDNFLLHCPTFHDKRHTLLSTLNNIDSKILESHDSYLTQTLVFGSIRLIQRQTHLLLTQPLTIFYLLKDSKNLF